MLRLNFFKILKFLHHCFNENMICSRNITYILIIFGLPFQFAFHLCFFTYGVSNIQANWDFNKISKSQLEIANLITKYTATISPICYIFISYKIKKRRLLISIFFLISGIIWLVYLAINDSNLWLSILLRCLNGIVLGVFQSAQMSYLMHFSEEKLHGFHGSLVEVGITLSISILNLLFYAFSWKIVSVILSIESFIFSGLIWLIPEYRVIPKSYSRQYIYRSPYLKYVLIMMSIMTIQLFSGIGFMIDNCPRLLKDIGIEMGPYLQLALSNFISCLTAFIGAFIIDAVGVRYMWAFSAFGTVLSLIIYDITLKIDCPKWVGVFGVFLYFLFFGFGEGTIPWMLSGLLFPESLMIESASLLTFTNRFMDIWFDYFLKYVTKGLGEFGAIAFNAGVSLFGIWFGLFFIPNLKKKYIEEITVF